MTNDRIWAALLLVVSFGLCFFGVARVVYRKRTGGTIAIGALLLVGWALAILGELLFVTSP